MAETWKPVVGFEDCYSVSDQGRCARIATYGKAPKPIFRLLAQRVKRDGYLTYHLCQDGKRVDAHAHILVWKAFKGPISESLEINHKNNVRHDARLHNLELMTRSENAAYAFRAFGRAPANNPSYGSKNGSAKLTEADIPKIFAMRRAGAYQYEIAKKFGVSQRVICQILLGRIWKQAH